MKAAWYERNGNARDVLQVGELGKLGKLGKLNKKEEYRIPLILDKLD